MLPPIHRIPMPHEPGGMRLLSCGCSAHGPVPEGIIPGFRNSNCPDHGDFIRMRSPQTIYLRTGGDDYDYEFVQSGLRVTRVPSDSDYYSYLYTGDVITHVDFAPYQPGMFGSLKKKLLAGERQSFKISVNRLAANRPLVFNLVKV